MQVALDKSICQMHKHKLCHITVTDETIKADNERLRNKDFSYQLTLRSALSMNISCEEQNPPNEMQ